MKTIKIIDLLNKIANGEEVPKKIKFDKYIFELDKLNTNYISEWERNLTFHLGQFQEYALNDEVEILDEEDEFEDIEEVEVYHQYDEALIKNYGKEFMVNLGVELLADKINDLIKNQKKIIEKLNKE